MNIDDLAWRQVRLLMKAHVRWENEKSRKLLIILRASRATPEAFASTLEIFQ